MRTQCVSVLALLDWCLISFMFCERKRGTLMQSMGCMLLGFLLYLGADCRLGDFRDRLIPETVAFSSPYQQTLCRKPR